MARFGVIDMGSNSVRLVIYEIAKNRRDAFALGRLPAHDSYRVFKSILDEKRVAGLSSYIDYGKGEGEGREGGAGGEGGAGKDGHELFERTPSISSPPQAPKSRISAPTFPAQAGILTNAGIAAAVDALKAHLRRTRDLGCSHVEVFATAFLRNCANSETARVAIEDAAGKKIHLLSARDEAHLGYVGASCNGALGDSALIDIGGGSTELTCVRADTDSKNVSLPFGSVAAYTAHVSKVIPTAEELAEITAEYKTYFATYEGGSEAAWQPADGLICPPGDGEFSLHEKSSSPPSQKMPPPPSSLFSQRLIDPADYSGPRIYGIGGGSRATYRLARELFGADVIGEDGTFARRPTVSLYTVQKIYDTIANEPSRFAHAAVRVVPSRLHTCGPGVAIMLESMKQFGVAELVVCKYGLREGYLLERMLKR